MLTACVLFVFSRLLLPPSKDVQDLLGEPGEHRYSRGVDQSVAVAPSRLIGLCVAGQWRPGCGRPTPGLQMEAGGGWWCLRRSCNKRYLLASRTPLACSSSTCYGTSTRKSRQRRGSAPFNRVCSTSQVI